MERVIAELAEAQAGVMSRQQLQNRGMSLEVVDWWVGVRRLHPVHHGVYSIAPPSLLTSRGVRIAALLACGKDAALSHRTAAEELGLLRTSRRIVDVTSPRNLRDRDEVKVHWGPLPPEDVVAVDGLRVTSPTRTLIDLALVLTPRELERALDRAEYRRLPVDPAGSTRPGAGKLRAALGGDWLHSDGDGEIADAFIASLDSAGLPRPEMEVPFTLPDGTPIRIDALYRHRRLAIELDGRGAHARERGFERDRHRDAQLTIAGLRPLRFTWRQIRSGDAVRTVAQLIA